MFSKIIFSRTVGTSQQTMYYFFHFLPTIKLRHCLFSLENQKTKKIEELDIYAEYFLFQILDIFVPMRYLGSYNLTVFCTLEIIHFLISSFFL